MKKVYLALAALAASPVSAFAGAWVQHQGSGQAILTARYLTAKPSKVEVNPLVEYGLTSRFTVGANIGYRAIDREAGRGSLGYAEAYGRYAFVQSGGHVLSAQVMAGSAARGLNARVDSSFGVGEARLLYGYGFGMGRLGSGYIDLQTAYRSFFGKVGSEWRSELSAGWKFAPGWIALAQGFHTENLRANPTVYDYDSWQVQGSVVAPLGKRWAVQGGWNKTVGGERVRFDSNIFAAIWFGF